MTVHRHIRAYGEHPRQVGEWFLPTHAQGAAFVVLIHGGFWRPQWDRSLEVNVACDLAEQGLAVWNIEYRSYDQPWPATFEDVAAAVEYGLGTAQDFNVDTSRSAIVGHSAGGLLALWAISQSELPANPSLQALRVRHTFKMAVVTAGVADLQQAATEGVGDGAVENLMGGLPNEVPDRYVVSDPYVLTPNPATRIVLLHGTADDEVPVSQSRAYVKRMSERSQDVRLIEFPGGGHYEILDPTSQESVLRRDLLVEL
jgi:dipeptidyl aminopeptidase/acylaminoacyl peptidase